MTFRASLPQTFEPAAALMVTEALNESGLEFAYAPEHKEITLIATRLPLQVIKRLDDAIRYVNDHHVFQNCRQVDWRAGANRKDSLAKNYLKHLFGNQVEVTCHPATDTKPAHIIMKTRMDNPAIDSGMERLRLFLREEKIHFDVDKADENKGEYRFDISPTFLSAQMIFHDDDYGRVATPSAAR